MRILHLVNTGQRRGAETFASDLIASMNDEAIGQAVLVLHGSGPTAIHFDAPVTTLGASSGVPLVRVAPRAVSAIRSYIRGWRPDIAQAHGGDSLKYSVAAMTGRRAPIVYRAIGLAPRWILHGPRRIVYSYLLQRPERVVAVADAVRRQLLETFGLPRARVITIPNGVDPRRLEPTKGREATRRMLGIPSAHKVLLSVGALTWEKDPLAHLEVSSRVMESRPDVIHVMAGDGPMRQELERAILRRRLEGRVLLLGSRNDVSDLLSAADVVLFASRPDGMEGMPATIIEAGMMGRPVAAYAVAGVSEVVLHGRTGLLAEPDDLAGLTNCTLRLIDDEDERRVLGLAATQRYRSRYGIRTIADQYLALYTELLG